VGGDGDGSGDPRRDRGASHGVDRDRKADLVAGTPLAHAGGRRWAGAVAVLYGARNGLALRRSRGLNQNKPGVPGPAERLAKFGAWLSLLDHNGDGRLDLGIGVTLEGSDRRGQTMVLYGNGRAFSTAGAEYFGLGDLRP
jgi:hypothetical protein